MKFIHNYNEHYLPGLEQQGLWNRDSGLKLTQHFATPAAETFNVLAARGGKLHRMVQEHALPFHVDRLQGGTFYSRYDFDHALLREYRERLGDWFLGIQMHEWGSTLNMDWNRIRKQLAGTPPPWTEAQIVEAIRKVSACPWCLHLSQGSAREYSQKAYAETRPLYLEEMRRLFQLRQDETDGLLLPCDSSTLATSMEYQLGARAVMPELGAGTPLTRLQVSMARGMSTARGRPWGVYYEPWGGSPFSAPHFFDGPLNEWRLDSTIFPFDFTSCGPHGGSSRSLQRRIYYHALLSGAWFISEEWGMSNTFHNWRDYPLTPYGEIKKDFIEFAAASPPLAPFVPCAIILPREAAVVDLGYVASLDSERYLDRPLAPADKTLFGHVRNVLRLIFAAQGKLLGNETYVLTNSRFGDFFDVLDEDAGEPALAKYACVIDASPDNGFAQSAAGRKLRTRSSADLGQLEDDLDRMVAAEWPCHVGGGIHWLLSRTDDTWWLGLFNNNGVKRDGEQGDAFLSEAAMTAVIRFNGEPQGVRRLKHWPETQNTLTRRDDGAYLCAVAPGGFCILAFHLAPKRDVIPGNGQWQSGEASAR